MASGVENLYVYNGTTWVKHLSETDTFQAILPDIITPGTFKSVTVNSRGLVTAGTNPTTLAGFGITDGVATVNGKSGNSITLTTSDINEGTNLYFTTVRAQAAISGTAGRTTVSAGVVDLASGIVAANTYKSVTVDTYGRVTAGTNPTTLAGFGIVDGVTSVNTKTGVVSLTTTDISEGTNQYFTTARARSSVSFTAGSGAYNSSTGIITIPTNTSQLTNGANFITLASLSAGAGISYNNATGAIASTITQYTDSLARAALSFTAGSGAYNSATGAFTIPTNTNQLTNGANFITLASLSGGTGISYNNATGAISSTITQYTDTLARASLSFSAGSGAYNSTTGVITIPTNTNQLTNGANFITLTSLSAGTGISYNNATGVISSTSSGVSSVNTLTGAVTLTTTNIAEGTNLYFTDARARTAVTNATLPASISMPSSSGTAMKISGTYGWRDLIGDVTPRGTGGAAATLGTFRGNVRAWYYQAADQGDCFFHMPHDYAPGTDLFIHVHWSHNATNISGSLIVNFYATYAKGHQQASFPAQVNPALTVSSLNITNTPQYFHRVDEIQLSTPGGSSTQLDTNALEVDGMVMVNFTTSTIPTLTGGTPNNPYIIAVDLHYQSTGLPTKNKAPSFYV